MNRLALEPDIKMPSADVECVDQELTHPARLAAYQAAYSQLCGRPISDVRGLVRAFYLRHVDTGYAGFKTMFTRHPQLAHFLSAPDIQFICLGRRDYLATVASFLYARLTKSW